MDIIEVTDVDKLIIKDNNKRMKEVLEQLSELKSNANILNIELDQQQLILDTIDDEVVAATNQVILVSNQLSIIDEYYEADSFGKMKTVGGIILGSAIGASCLAIGVVPGLIAIGIGGTIGGLGGYCSKYLKRLT